jgi:uncharacterized metal-binding protein
MPSGKTHDLVTLALAAPTFAAAWGLTGSLTLSAAATGAMIFGGLMFGPDLDIQSRQYTRWGVFRFLWFPYKAAFRHRSRWSHGIVFGTLIRVVYFALVLTLLLWAFVYARAFFTAGGEVPGWREVVQVWRTLEGAAAARGIGPHVLLAVLAGLWWGAASHTLTDVFWTVVRKGSEIF